MILNFALRHEITDVAIQDLLRLINFIFQEKKIIETEHCFRGIFKTELKSDFHFYCSNCNTYLGKHSISKEKRYRQNIKCPTCDTDCNICKMNNGHFFITFSMAEQIRTLLETTENIMELLCYRDKYLYENDIFDTFSGTIYKDLCKNGSILCNRNNLSITFYTDGCPVFKSRKNTLWPIQFRLNEFPPKERFALKNTMICGLWFGDKDPDMIQFLSPFLCEAKKLHSEGLNWTSPTGVRINSKIIVLNCVLDSIAKPLVQQIKQFNGFYGCSYCTHPGYGLMPSVDLDTNPITVKYAMNIGDNFVINMLQDNSLTYTVTRIERATNITKIYEVEDRTNDGIRKDMLQVEQTGIEVRGVKGISPLAVLLEFNLVNGFVLDYMHCVLLGVVKFVTCLWLDSTSHNEKYYIELKRNDIDNRLLAIRPPSSFPRLLRSLKERSFWKANEWRAWLLYYSLPCLKDILPLKYYKHHCVLVSAIYTFLQHKISISNLDNATWHLIQYVIDFQKLYGPHNMTYNVHLLLHLGKTVLMFGPLWCYSAFSWESGNGFLVKLVKGTRGVLTQIARKYTYLQSLSRLLCKYNVSDSTINYCSTIFNYHLQKHVTKLVNVTLLGKEVEISLTVEETNAFIKEKIHITNLCYERMIKDHIKYHSRCYAKQGSKTIDHIVKLDDDSYASIERIFVSSLNKQPPSIFVLLTTIILEDAETIASYLSRSKVSHIKLCSFYMFGSLKIRPVQSIVQKVIMINCTDTESYIAQFPNTFESD
ncbi:uncharacterized protein [Linepithema humile]